ncbi:hypothetical protein CP09DC79_0442A, partial [Chlamydia psittaci 09DC79]
MELTLNWRP